MNSAQKYTEKKEDQRKFKKLWERIYFQNILILVWSRESKITYTTLVYFYFQFQKCLKNPVNSAQNYKNILLSSITFYVKIFLKKTFFLQICRKKFYKKNVKSDTVNNIKEK